MYDEPATRHAWLCRWSDHSAIVYAATIEEARRQVQRDHQYAGPVSARLATKAETAGAA